MPVLSMTIVILALATLQNILYAKLWDKKLHLKITFSAKEAFEGDELYLSEELTNEKLLPLPWLAAKFQISRNLLFINEKNARISDDYYQNDLFSIMMYQRITRKLPFICGRRGFYRIKSTSLVSNDLLYTRTFTTRRACDSQLTVFPRLIPFEKMNRLYKQIDGAILSHRLTNPDPFEFKGIREYQLQDGLRAVNFKASAKAQKLMVNINGSTASQQIVIILNLQSYSSWPREQLYEQAIRLAASLSEYYISDGVSLSLVTNGRDITTGSPITIPSGSSRGHLHHIFEALARIDLSLEMEPICPLLENLTVYEPVYLFISTYHEQDIIHAFYDLLARGMDAYWTVPVFIDMKIDVSESDRVTIWEVDPNDV